MSAQAPQVLSRRTNGAPPSAASQTNESSKVKTAVEGSAVRSSRGKGPSDKGTETKSTNDTDAPKSSRTKTPSEGEKLVVRRLPPGMTQAEFVSILGQDWETGKGRVDWFYYARGKVSNDPSKPTRPGRAYLHLMRKDYIQPLSEVVRSACWEDAKNTYTNPSLVGPPSLEFAVYKKVPGNKKRTDARQGTIDQDPEFMAFLEGLANPSLAKDGPENDEGEEEGKSEITTTPLIEYLKEKKANKIKEAAAAKSAKHSRLEPSSKGRTSGKETEGSGRKGKDSKSSKSDKGPAKENVKILTKKAAVEQVAETARNIASQISSAGSSAGPSSSTASSAPTTAAVESAPKNRRAGIAQAARILQRDLGLSPGSAHRRARQDAAKADADTKTTSASAAGRDKENSSLARESQQPSSAAPAEPTTTQAPKAQAASSSSSTSKAQSSSRRSRGTGSKASERSKNTDSTSAENLTPAAPMILKKKPAANENDTQRAATAATITSSSQSRTTPASTATATSSSNSSKPNANVSGGLKAASAQKATASAKKNASNSSTGNSNSNSHNHSHNTGSTASANAARGFVKHVSTSQGMSESALRQAFETFGPITSLEIDKRKGFAYVDFADHASLSKAISGSPISVAQGTVNVMERKDKKPAPASATTGQPSGTTAAPAPAAGAASEKSTSRGRRGRGGGGGGGGGGGNKNHATTNGGSQAHAADASTMNGPG